MIDDRINEAQPRNEQEEKRGEERSSGSGSESERRRLTLELRALATGMPKWSVGLWQFTLDRKSVHITNSIKTRYFIRIRLIHAKLTS